MSDPAALALAQALIRCPSVTPADAGALAVLASALEPLGFRCRRLTFAAPGSAPIDNLVAVLGSGRPHLCFAGHTDVVPSGPAAAWRCDPFGGEIRDGWLIGRGAVDMKGGIAAFVAATAEHLRQNGPPAGTLSLLITGDEEGPAINGTAPTLAWMEAEGLAPDAAIVGEPTSAETPGDTLKIGRRGSMTVQLTVPGTQGHTAYPHLADNPVHRLIALLAAVTAAPVDEPTAHFPATTLQVTTIDVGNPAANIIPGEARATLNLRFNDRHSGASLTGWLEQRFAAAAAGGRWSMEVSVAGEAFLTAPGPFTALVAEAAAAETGHAPQLSTTGGTSDARFIRRLCPVVELGLVGRTLHQVDERTSFADLARLTAIYRRVIDRFFTAGAG